MTPATNSAALQLPEAPARPQLRLLEGRVSESVLVGRALLADRALPEDEAALSRMGLTPPNGIGGRVLRRLMALGLAAAR